MVKEHTGAHRLQTGRLSRRRVLEGTAVAGVGLAAAATIGCQGERQPAATLVTKEPKRGGAISRKSGFEASGNTLDPHQQALLGAMAYRLWYQGLLAYNVRTYEIQPELAQKWEQPSQAELVFTLQPGVKWHNKPPANGRALTAEDVVFGLNRVRTADPRFLSRSLLDAVDSIEAVDRATVKLTTKVTDATVLEKLSGDTMMILAPEVVERVAKFVTAEEVVGTGAFILQSLEPFVGAESVRNPDYWKPGLPYVDRFYSRYFQDDQGAYAAFLAGKLDTVLLPGTEVKNYIARQGPNYTPDWFKDITMIVVLPNTRVKPFDDQRVTRALRLLIDHQEFRTAWAETIAGRGGYGSIFPPALDAWDLTEEEYTQSIFWRQPKDDAVREALALLSAAGFTRENPLRFELSHQGPADLFIVGAQLIQAQWRRLSQGVVEAAPLKMYDTAQMLQVQAQGGFAYFLSGTGASATEADAWLRQLYRTGGSRNVTRFSDPKLDDMIDRQRAIFDVQQRRAAVKEIVRYMIDHSPGVTLNHRYFLNGVKPHVRDYAPEFHIQGLQYERVWLDT